MEYSPPPLFKQGPSARVRLTFYVVLSLTLLVLDNRYGALEVLRKAIGTGLYPLQSLASMPVQAAKDISSYFTTLTKLQAENEELIKQRLFDRQKLLELKTVEAENENLRKLNHVGKTLEVQHAILTEVTSDANDPFSRKVIVGKGLIQGVREGMPVIDELGLVGQVTRAFPSRSEISLITDKDQIIPVENLRNGLRSVAYGGLDGGLLELRFMANNADIQNNDLMVTSGLDGIYPRGIPVARVTRVERNARYAFSSIFCTPIAGVEQHRFVLILDTVKPPELTPKGPIPPNVPVMEPPLPPAKPEAPADPAKKADNETVKKPHTEKKPEGKKHGA